MKIETTNVDNITRENINEESLVKIILENFDVSDVFANPNTAETARGFFLSTSVHEKTTEIAEMLRGLTEEYSEEAVSEVFKKIINTDHQLFSDIMTAAYLIAIKYDDKQYVKTMFAMKDFIDNDIIVTDVTEDIDNEVSATEEEIPVVDEDEDIK